MGTRFFAASIAALIGSILFPGMEPPEGRVYQALLGMRKPVPVAREILLVEADSREKAVPPGAGDLAEILLVMTEMEADRVVLQLPVAEERTRGGLESDKFRSVSRRFDEEFALIERNIRTLFEAIRLGSVRPRETSRYVEETAGLVNEGKKRLLSAVVNAEDAGMVFFEQARTVKGRVWSTPDSRSDEGDPRQAVLFALADRMGSQGFEHRDSRLVFPGVLSLPVKPDGEILIEEPRTSGEEPAFRRLDLHSLLRLVRLDREFYRDLAAMEAAGYFYDLDPGAYPTILYDHAQTLREEFLVEPEERKTDEWRRSRTRYYTAAREYLFGSTEDKLVSGYDLLGTSEALDEAGAARLIALREAVAGSFSRSRKTYTELSALRSRIDSALRGSFCILGYGPGDTRPNETETAALLANGIISGRYIESMHGYRQNLLALLLGLALAGLLAPLGTIGSLAAGLSLSVLAGAAAAWAFLSAGLWIHPVALPAALAATTISAVLVPAFIRRRMNSAQVRIADTAVIAVRHGGTADPEKLEDRVRRARELKDFRERTGREIHRLGGTLLEVDGAVVIAAFGVPQDLEETPYIPARKACEAALSLIGPEAAEGDGCGIDLGECAFHHSEIGGRTAIGSPLIRARLISGLAVKYGSRILITGSARSALGYEWQTRNFDKSPVRMDGKESPLWEVTGLRGR